MPGHEVDRLLVEGELVVRDDGGAQRVWPSQRSIARRFGVAPSLVSDFSKRHRCGERREAYRAGAPFECAIEVEPVALEEPDAHEQEPEAQEEVQEAPVRLDATTEGKRRPGRPRKADAPLIFYDELDRLLVLGEVKVLENGATTTVYPPYRQLADRYGVAMSVIADYAKSHNCIRRRAEAQNRLVFRTEEKVLEKRAEAQAVGKDRVVRMIDDYLIGFEKALEDGRVRFDNPTDVNTFARLREFIMGGADSRTEAHGVITLESLQLRHAKMLRERRNETPEMTGMIDVRPVPRNETEQPTDSTRADRFLGGVCSVFSEQPPDSEANKTEHEPIARVDETEQRAAFSFAISTKEVRELVSLVRELAHAGGVGADDAGLVGRVLRAAERVEQRLAEHDGADAWAADADAKEHER